MDGVVPAAHRRSHLDRIAGQCGVGVIRGRAGQQPARMQIQHRSEIQLAFVGGDLGDVPAPLHVRRRGGEVAVHQVGELGRRLTAWRVNPRRRFGLRPCRPWRRIESATVFTLTVSPASSRSAWMRGEP